MRAAAALVEGLERVLGDRSSTPPSAVDALGALYLRFNEIAAEHDEECKRMRAARHIVDDAGLSPEAHETLATAWRAAARLAQESLERVKTCRRLPQRAGTATTGDYR